MKTSTRLVAVAVRLAAVFGLGCLANPGAVQAQGSPRTVGPDVTVFDVAYNDSGFFQINNYGSQNGISAFSIGTRSCNIGDAWVSWVQGTNRHPVIAQNLYRLKDGRFEQIGMSWLKHGFYAVNEQDICGPCTSYPKNQQGDNTGVALGIECTDPYNAGYNGQQNLLGPRFQVNAVTGDFPYPPYRPAYSGSIARRLQVHDVDLDPAQLGGGTYFAEAQYVTADDALAGNGDNNASYRQVTVARNGGIWELRTSNSTPTQRQTAAIRVWHAIDPAVLETEVQVPGDGLITVASKATDLGAGRWRYEYAVHNLNSDRSVGGFGIPVPATAAITTVGFHDVDYHSGEPFDGTDWSTSTLDGMLNWATTDYATNPNANALRWATLYNFRFDVNRAPEPASTATLQLFKPGTPSAVTAAVVGPSLRCGNGTVDEGEACDPPDGSHCGSDCQLIPCAMLTFTDDLEEDRGWTVGAPGDNATTGVWELVDPVGTSAQPEDDHTLGTGHMCFVTGQQPAGGSAGSNDVDGGKTTLVSPLINVGHGDAIISYWRWYSNNAGSAPNADVFTVEVSYDDGANWNPVETVGPSGLETGGGWNYHEFTAADSLTTSDTVRLRFVASDLADGSIVEAAVDDLQIRTNLGAALPGDVNADGQRDGSDVAPFVDALLAGGAGATGACPADVDGNGQTDFNDIGPFINLLIGG